jgi:hypothetical protein
MSATIVGESGNTREENARLLRRHEERIEMHKWVAGLAPWELAWTGTFRWEASLASAQRSIERFFKRECPDVIYFYALEENRFREGCHGHALWANTAGIYRKFLWERWFVRFGRNRLEPIKSRIAAEEYLTKYVTKELSWWNTNAGQVEAMLPDLAEKPGKRRRKGKVVSPAGVTPPEQAEKFCSRLERELTMEARSS